MFGKPLFTALVFWFLPLAGHGQVFSNSVEVAEADRFGCPISERPDHMTFHSFRDGWRSAAADKLYDLQRYIGVLEAQDCDCAQIRPNWSVIEDEYNALGFAKGTISDYDQWADEVYFPEISKLRDQVHALCKETD